MTKLSASAGISSVSATICPRTSVCAGNKQHRIYVCRRRWSRCRANAKIAQLWFSAEHINETESGLKHFGAEAVQGDVIGVGIHVGTMNGAVAQIAEWAKNRESRTVFFCNAHSLAHARMHKEFRTTLDDGDLRLPDGAPVAHVLRQKGFEDQKRVCGPDLMLEYFAHASDRGEAVFLYGSTPATLEKLRARCAEDFPGLQVHAYSPPFRKLSRTEDEEVVRMITESGAKTLWVALGCPKQEHWIIEHRGRIPAVMLGVGAAFAFHAGVMSRAPQWMQQAGLEWLQRLVMDPRRMWKRYLVTNSVFLFYAAMGALKHRKSQRLRSRGLKTKASTK